MAEIEFSHITKEGLPTMVDVSEKAVTSRMAHARGYVMPGPMVMGLLKDGEINAPKGPVFQTAIIAGVLASKKTAELIPFCHSLPLDHCEIKINAEAERIVVEAIVKCTGKTGVEMEALHAVQIAALTIYDMCKAITPTIVLGEIKLLEKKGGKNHYKFEGL